MPWNTLCGFPPTKDKIRLMIPNAAWRPDTVITDIDGNEMYVLLDQENKMRSYQAVFGDLDGRRLVCVKRHLTKAFWKDGYYFCTYRPNYPNQRPLKDRDLDNKKIYPFSYLELEPMKGRFYYKYFDDDQQLGPTRLFAENPWLGFMMVCCSPLLRCSRFSTRFKKTSRKTHIHVDQWRNIVSVKPGSDLLAALCMAYVFDRCQAQPMVTVIGRDEDDEYEDSDESLESISSNDDNDDPYYKTGDDDDDDDDDKKKKVNFEIDGNPEANYKDQPHQNGGTNGQRGTWKNDDADDDGDDSDDDDDDDGDDYNDIHRNNHNNRDYDENASTKAASVFSAASTLAAPPKVVAPANETTTPTDDFFAATSSSQPRDPDGHTVTSSAVRSRASQQPQQQPDFFSAPDAKSVASGRVSVASRGQASVASARQASVASGRVSVVSRQQQQDPYGHQPKPNEIV